MERDPAYITLWTSAICAISQKHGTYAILAFILCFDCTHLYGTANTWDLLKLSGPIIPTCDRSLCFVATAAVMALYAHNFH